MTFKIHSFETVHFSIMKKLWDLKKSSVTWSWKNKGVEDHGSDTPPSPGAILLGKMAYHTKQIRRQCIELADIIWGNAIVKIFTIANGIFFYISKRHNVPFQVLP